MKTFLCLRIRSNGLFNNLMMIKLVCNQHQASPKEMLPIHCCCMKSHRHPSHIMQLVLDQKKVAPASEKSHSPFNLSLIDETQFSDG